MKRNDEELQLSRDALFSAKTVAIVGISAQRQDGWGRAILASMQLGEFPGEIWAIHPTSDIDGVKTFRSFDELPDAPDLVAVCVPAERVIDVVSAASQRGAKGAVVFSAGFAEHSTDGVELQQRLVAAAGDMPFVGPNCVGIANFHEKLCLNAVAALSSYTAAPGEVAIVTQSGAIGAVIADSLHSAGVGISHFVSTGNASTLTGPMLAERLLSDPRVRILVGYIESASQSAEWARLGDYAEELGKHIVLLVVGKTMAARQAAVAHTAAASGDALLFGGVVRAHGVHLADDEDEVTDLVVALRRGHRLPAQPRIAIVTNSGGAGAILVDKIATINGEVAVFSEETTTALRKLGVFEASVQNPVDIGGNWERALAAIPEVLDLLGADPGVDAVVTCFSFGGGQEPALRAIPDHAAASANPFVQVWAAQPEGATRDLAAADLVVGSIAAGLRRLQAMQKAGLAVHSPATQHDTPVVIDLTGYEATIAESDAAGILRELGADVVASHVLSADDDAAELVRALGAGPWVVKGESENIPHRASVGLVALNVAHPELASTIEATRKRLQECDGGPLARVVVQEQLTFSAVVAVGAIRDDHHGPVVVVGPGGAHAESRDSRRQALGLPASAASIATFSAELAASFDVDASALSELIHAVSRCLLADEAIRAVEINPAVRVAGDRLVAVDALIVLAAEHEREHAARPELLPSRTTITH